MARQCGWCTHRHRVELERRVLDGESTRLVAADSGLSESAANRHIRNHLEPALRSELRTGTAGMHVADFGQRLVELVDETQEVRERAREANDPRLLLQAVGSERETLGVLMTKLGIDSNEMLETITEARALVDAARAVLVHHPNVVEEMAVFLRTQTSASEMADAFEYLTKKGRAAALAVASKESQ